MHYCKVCKRWIELGKYIGVWKSGQRLRKCKFCHRISSGLLSILSQLQDHNFLMTRLNTSMFDSHASALLPARVSRHRFPFEAMSTPDVNIRKPRQWASCNAPHMLVCAGDVNTRKPPDKRLFFGLHQDTTVPPGDVAQLCVAQVSPRLGRVG